MKLRITISIIISFTSLAIGSKFETYNCTPYPAQSTDTIYASNGKVKAIFFRSFGNADSVLIYYSNGQKRARESFKNGFKDGLFLDWYENGNLSNKVEFTQDIEVFRSKETWDSTGQPNFKYIDTLNQIVIFREYFSDHKMKYTCSYKNGIPIDSSISWYQNGKIRSVVHFENGKSIVNKSNQYDELGNCLDSQIKEYLNKLRIAIQTEYQRTLNKNADIGSGYLRYHIISDKNGPCFILFFTELHCMAFDDNVIKILKTIPYLDFDSRKFFELFLFVKFVAN